MIAETDSENLLINLKNGDKRAFTRIFQLFNSRLTYFAKSYVLDQDIAQNIVQDSYISWKPIL